jgi:protein-S-isoprenylcysteine O-methyltransferase Ste14
MRLEELALAEEFPAYAAYAAETPRIVPLLSRSRRLGPVAIGRGR